MRFDEFVMERMGYPWGENEPDKQTRRQAFLVFRQRTGRVDFASLPTMHRWFGINGYHKPSRYNIFQMAFAMGLDREETKQYLMVGIGEPSFYVNDYQEMIYLYGIDHKKSMEQCEKMIAFYEENLEDNVVISHTRSTRELMNAYEGTLDFSTEEFLWWMGGRADWFKGYSQTALNYVKQYRDSILSWVRDEEKKRLDELLAEVNFPAWQQKHGKRRETPRKQIDRFLHKNRYARQYTVAQHMQEVIWELAKSVYATKPSNAKFLSEVFGDSSRYAKRYSDLFRGPIQKEQLIHAAQAKRQLKHLPGGAQVPEWILKFIAENIHTEEACRDVKTARACLETWSADKKQRCPQIQREDLLPLIYTVCLQRAPAGEAKEMFLRLSEATLTACNMSRLDERFELDAVLLHYIEQDEVYWYGDICEEMGL